MIDLSKEFHPVPKPQKREKRHPKRINPIGKKGRDNLDNVAQRKIEFERVGITECEARLAPCWRNNALGFAHAKKRRKLTKEELKKVILICNPCHSIIEVLPAEDMEAFVDKVIANRKVQP